MKAWILPLGVLFMKCGKAAHPGCRVSAIEEENGLCQNAGVYFRRDSVRRRTCISSCLISPAELNGTPWSTAVSEKHTTFSYSHYAAESAEFLKTKVIVSTRFQGSTGLRK